MEKYKKYCKKLTQIQIETQKQKQKTFNFFFEFLSKFFMSQEFANFAPSQNIPQNNSENNTPNQSNYGPRQEKQAAWGRAIARSQSTKTASKTIKSARASFVAFLNQNGMNLLTSAVEFARCGDFIKSSYIIYTRHDDFRQPLEQFLQQYPQYLNGVIQIRDFLRQTQNQVQVGNYLNSQNY